MSPWALGPQKEAAASVSPSAAGSRLKSMSVMAPTTLSATEMARLVRRRELSPVELVEAHLARIEALNPRLNAFVEVDETSAPPATHPESLMAVA